MDESGEERLRRRDGDGVLDADQRGDRDHGGNGRVAGAGENGQRPRRRHRQDLRRDQEPLPVEPVGQRSSREREEEHGHEHHRRGDPHHECSVGEVLDEHSLRHRLQERPRVRHELPGEEDAEVAIP